MSFFKSCVGWFAILTAADIIKEYNSGTGIGYRGLQGPEKSWQENFADWRESNKEELSKETPHDVWHRKMWDDPTGDHSEAYREALEWSNQELRRWDAYAKKYGL